MWKGSLLGNATAVTLGTAMLWLTACAGDVGDINQIQPGYVSKAELQDGSWYYRRTVVDKSEALGGYLAIGTGDLFTMERLRWDVQEKYLIGYRDYEYTAGGDENTYEGGAEGYEGSPVAIFAITSHFDAVRAYNSATLEDTNVITENASDRPWYEREFMRVDWSANQNPEDPYWSVLGVDIYDTDNKRGGGQFYVHENDDVSPWRARITPGEGYIDFVTNHFITSDPYACLDVFDMAWECGSGEVKIRHAFMKIDDAAHADYEELPYPDSVTLTDAQGEEIFDPETGEVVREGVFERFGFYRNDRVTYDNQRGLTESGRNYNIFRFNLWKKSKNADGSLIPYVDREVEPIVYYLNFDFPSELLDASIEVAEEWNDAFKAVISTLQQKPIDQVPDMFVLKQNTCTASNVGSFFAANASVKSAVEGSLEMAANTENINAHLANFCASAEYHSKGAFHWEQIGDPRYNMMYYIPNITGAGFAGYGPMLADPLTGQIIQATSYIQGWTIDSAATRALEYVDYINGELSLEDLLTGSNLPYRDELVTAGLNGYNPAQGLVTPEEITERIERVPSVDYLDSLKARLMSLGQTPTARLNPIENGDHFQERLKRVAGTALEAEYVLHPSDFMVAGRGDWEPGMPIDDELLERASLSHRHHGHSKRSDRYQRRLEEMTMCPMQELDDGLVGLAKELGCLGKCTSVCHPNGVPVDCVDRSAEERRTMRRDVLKERYYKAVMLHEVGHNVGLRHNFEASYDAVNYHDRFWDIETSGVSAQGKLDAKQPEYMYSSIMDYHGKSNSDFQGLGKYDRAAIKFGYGQIIETFADSSVQGGNTLRNWRFLNDYKQLLEPDTANAEPAYFTSNAQLKSRQDVIFDWRTVRSQQQVEAITAREVPYLFCSDEYAGYTPTCKRFDFGANAREQVTHDYVMYKNYFVFTHFLRNRLTLNWGRAFAPADTAFRNALTTYQYWYLYSSLDPDFITTDYGRDMAEAFAQGFNMMTETIATPEPGPRMRCDFGGANDIYYPANWVARWTPSGWVPDQGMPCSQVINLPIGHAQPLFLGFSSEFVNWTFTYLGSYFDKQSAVSWLTNPAAYFFRVNDIEDFRLQSVSPYRIYNKELLTFMGSLIQEDYLSIASYVDDRPQNLGADNVPLTGLLGKSLVDTQAPLDSDGRLPEPAGNLPIVYPAMGKQLQRQALLYGLAFMTSPLDTSLDFSKYTRVVLKGGEDDYSTFDDEPGRTAECTLPISGVTYRALRAEDDPEGLYSIGYNMVQLCAAAAAEYASLGSNAAGSAAEQDLAEMQEILQYARLIHMVYEHGAEL